MNSIEQLLGLSGPLSFTAIVVGLSVWLGRVWEKRIDQADKAKDSENLARLNSKLETERRVKESALLQLENANNRLRELASDVDLDLRTRRIEVYPSLWKETARLPLWPRNDELAYADLKELTLSLRKWYFEKGGIYLSRPTFDNAYRPLQETLRTLLETQPSGPVSDHDYKAVREKCSFLRSAMTDDVLSRRSLNVGTAQS